ncbi:MAG TPA: UDP-N-acetylmuramoyl-L-alanyl-D-glutamate--2,6-diaminopimelate ligase [Acholeplasmataceae bacterium]|nr:UDP-N-acetylmuramoyl-L-alanyl-D-glutamate--2,6-diaminopimelate ligase [Acholeplasmataceae bacterium]
MKVQKLFDQKLKFNHQINKVCINSKKVEENDIFVAISGSVHDGNDYIDEAIERGAKTIITENYFELENVNLIVVDDARKEVARILRKMHLNKCKMLKIIGVTGTNGKTTTTTLVYRYLKSIGLKACLLGSNGIYLDGKFIETINTTPDITIIYDMLLQAYYNHYKYVVMEVSSHAIKQMRIMGIDFTIVLLTNLTLDHLELHKTFLDYQYTKGLLINRISVDNYVILNRDDEYYPFFNQLACAKTLTFGLKNSNYQLYDIILKDDMSYFKIKFKKNTYQFQTNFLGMFNVYNIAAFIAIIDTLGLFSFEKVKAFLDGNITIPGRMEEVEYKGRKIIVDFAHTPDGIFKVLTFLRSLNRRIILVVGCGGSRDKTKRRVVGEIAVSNSDYVIFTSDNPRDEDEMDIINDIIRDIENENFEVETNRVEAIKKAIKISKPNDIIAILGRGNEQYQIVKGKLIPLDDMKVVKEVIGGDLN